jgi:hypothetical protein
MQQLTGEERAFAFKAYYQNGESLVKAILRVLFSKHKFSNWHKIKWLFICFSFMTNKQIKYSCVDFF